MRQSQNEQEKAAGADSKHKKANRAVLKAVRRLVKGFVVAGDTVTISGLTSKQGKQLNGQTGTVETNLDPASGRYIITRGGLLKI